MLFRGESLEIWDIIKPTFLWSNLNKPSTNLSWHYLPVPTIILCINNYLAGIIQQVNLAESIKNYSLLGNFWADLLHSPSTYQYDGSFWLLDWFFKIVDRFAGKMVIFVGFFGKGGKIYPEVFLYLLNMNVDSILNCICFFDSRGKT